MGKRRAARSRGQIIPKAKDKFLVRVYLGRNGGKRRYSSEQVTGSKKDAEIRLTELLRDLDTNTFVEPSNKTVGKFLTEWLATKQGTVALSSYVSYKTKVDRWLVPELGHVRLYDLSPVHIQRLYSQLVHGGLAPRTIRGVHAVLRMALQKAVHWGLIRFNPASEGRVDLPKIRKRPASILTPEQVQKLLDVTAPTRYHALWVTLLTSGLRPSECLARTWADLTPAGLVVNSALALTGEGGKYGVVETTKTDSSVRTVALPASTLAVLEQHRRRQTREILKAGDRYTRNGFIFANSQGGFLDISRVRQAWKRALKKAGLPRKVRLYDTRHTHISHLLLGGVDLKLASHRAGHSSIRLTADTYGHVLQQSEQMMAEVTEKLYFGVQGG